MINMKRVIIASVCFAFMLLFTLPTADSQIIALHPLKGNSPDAAKTFFDEMVRALEEFPQYTPYIINLEDDESIDISTGGYPAYRCPDTVLTNGAPYAFTGEVSSIFGYVEMYEMRLYLWDMQFQGLLISDELIVHEGETEAQYLPQLLAWMLSWIDRVKFVTPTEKIYVYIESDEKIILEKEIVYVDREIIIEPEVPEEPVKPQHWLRLGVKLGGGDSMWNLTDLDDNYKYVIHFINGGIGLHAAVNLLPWFAIQTEINFSVDTNFLLDKSNTKGFVSSYLTIPVLFRFNWEKNNIMASIYTGAYFYLPLFRIKNENHDDHGDTYNHKPQIPGFMVGGSMGWKVGPGHLFADARFEFDGQFWSAPVPGQTYYRNVTKLSIGYEMPLLVKKAKTPRAANTPAPPPTALTDDGITTDTEAELAPGEENLE
jgi:hypothetical protein